jgi:hypothetical protein
MVSKGGKITFANRELAMHPGAVFYGIEVTDRDGLAKKVSKSLASQVGAKLFSGGVQMWSLTMPCVIHVSKSNLELYGLEFAWMQILEEAT